MADTDEDTGRRRGGRDIGATVASFVATAVLVVAIVLAAILVVSILFFVFGANPENSIVDFVETTARDIVGPFEAMFDFENLKMQRTVNFGIAALVYLAIGTVISRLIRRLG